MLYMPGLTGNFAIDASHLFSSGHNSRRAMVEDLRDRLFRYLAFSFLRKVLDNFGERFAGAWRQPSRSGSSAAPIIGELISDAALDRVIEDRRVLRMARAPRSLEISYVGVL